MIKFTTCYKNGMKRELKERKRVWWKGERKIRNSKKWEEKNGKPSLGNVHKSDF